MKETIPFSAICGRNDRGKRIAAIRQEQMRGCDAEGALADHGATKDFVSQSRRQRSGWQFLREHDDAHLVELNDGEDSRVDSLLRRFCVDDYGELGFWTRG